MAGEQVQAAVFTAAKRRALDGRIEDLVASGRARTDQDQ